MTSATVALERAAAATRARLLPQPCWLPAAISVLRRRQATVIGPTPPGTGVIAPATSAASANATSPTRRGSAVRAVDAVDADVDHRGTGPDPVAADHLRPADRRDQDVGAAAFLRQVAGARVRERDRAVGAEQQRCHRLADDVGAADHDDPSPGEVLGPSVSAARIRQPQRRARHQERRIERAARREQPADVERMEAVDVLGRTSIASSTRAASICAGSGSWTRMPCTAGSRLSASTCAEQRRLGDRPRAARSAAPSMPASAAIRGPWCAT